MKLLIEGLDAAGNPGEHCRDARTPSVRIKVRIEADRGRLADSESRTARIALPQGLPLSRGENAETIDNAVSATVRKSDALLADLVPRTGEGPGIPDSPFQPPVRSLPLGGALLDDEAEGDGHHGEGRTAHPQCRNGQQHAREPGDQSAPTTSADQNGQSCAVVRMADGVGADRVERLRGRANLAAEPDEHVEADADDRGQPYV